MLFVTDSEGNLSAMTMEKKEKHYVYLDLGRKQFCTVAIPHEKRRADQNDFDDKGAFCCIWLKL